MTDYIDDKIKGLDVLADMDQEELEDTLTEMAEDIANGNRESLVGRTLILPTIAVRGMVIFPNSIIPFEVGRPKSKMALLEAAGNDELIFLTTQILDETPNPTFDEYYHTGTIAKVKKYKKQKDGSYSVLVEGLCKGVVTAEISSIPFIKCQVEAVGEPEFDENNLEIQAAHKFLVDKFHEYIALDNKVPDEFRETLSEYKNISNYPDFVVHNLDVPYSKRQQVLEAETIAQKISIATDILIDELQVLGAKQAVADKVKDRINSNQREYYLREQLYAIEEELGIASGDDDEVKTFLEKLKSLNLAEKTNEKIEKEIRRFSRMQPMSAESTVSRNYIETLLELPWNESSEATIDLTRAMEILEEDHFGLDKVKERVIEYLAVMSLTEGLKGPILCLVGPPGVGKTSIAKSVARATGREFHRMSLGGVRDEAEIRGHRRTYIGAIPGRIIDGIKTCGKNNPVFLLDEVDKLGADYKGDPSSALLEVLDPEQNRDFTDHYLEVPFDLSKVMFITTANTIDTIPRPLMDRMEVIEITGYTAQEKLEIAKRYLVRKEMENHGLTEKEFHLTEAAIKELINYYTRESGVRNLEREIAGLCRKVARKVVEGTTELPCKVTAKNITDYLGKRRFHFDKIKGETEVGVTTGLAWTSVGGVTLSIETAAVPGSGKLLLTGQLGDVMQESASAGISYIRSVADKLDIPENFYKEKDLHIHIPEGATPKDGPSAGVTMCTAIISTLTGIPCRKDIAMTGEITLRGKVLPVGGIKEKVLAAHRAGIRKVLLPQDNKPDIEDIPDNVRNEMEFVLLSKVDDALAQVLVK